MGTRLEITLEEIKPPVKPADVDFAVKAYKGLWEPVESYHAIGEMKTYLDEELARDDTWMFFATAKDGTRCGLVTVTRFAMPRYLGHAYEIEEVSVLPEHQGKGIAPQMLEQVAERFGKDPKARKLLIRTNGDNAKKAYGRIVSMTDMVSMHKFLNPLPADPAARKK